MFEVSTVRVDGLYIYISAPTSGPYRYAVSKLPYASCEDEGQWKVAYCRESVLLLQQWYDRGVLDDQAHVRSIDANSLQHHADAVLIPGRGGYEVLKAQTGVGPVDQRIAAGIPITNSKPPKVRGKRVPQPSGQKVERILLGGYAAGTLYAMMQEGVLADRHGLLRVSEDVDAVIGFDGRYGGFYSYGHPLVLDLLRSFPDVDVVSEASQQGVRVGFTDPYSRSMYAGELAFRGEGVQPAGMCIDLFPYQRRAVAKIVERPGTGLFLEPGLGKTAVAIAAAKELRDRGVIDRVFICPPPGAVASQWGKEISKFLGESNVLVLAGGESAAKREEAYRKAHMYNWVVAHHAIIARDEKALLPLMGERTMFIIDEGHKFLNITSNRSKTAQKFARRCGRRLVLTGTPVENTVQDWYSILGTLIEPNSLSSPSRFSSMYQRKNNIGIYEGVRNLDDLAARSQVHFIRYRKQDVAHHMAPLSVHHTPLKVDDPEYRNVLNEAHLKASTALEQYFQDAEVRSAGQVGQLTSYSLLRNLCTSPKLLHMSESGSSDALLDAVGIPDVDGPKVQVAIDIARQMQDQGERVVMFSFSRTMVIYLSERFTQEGIRHVVYHGLTPMSERIEAAERFVAEPDGTEPTVFLATDAAAEGFNLGARCNTLINIDLPWTPGRLEQRYNRIHRIDGTHDSYMCVNLTLSNTIEEGVLRKVESKARISDVLFGEAAADKLVGRFSESGDAIKEALDDWVRENGETQPAMF